MNTTNNTVLISGGSAGIGFEIARQLSEQGNRVIITGRDKERLEKSAAQLKNAVAISCDISNALETGQLVKRLVSEFPELNVVINNAGRAILYNLADENVNAFEKAQDEMLTNYLSVIRLNEQLLPHLKKQKEAAIVNVSSIVAFVPGRLATYSASKAALHSYTQMLRMELESSNIRVFELMPPLVNTEFSQAIGGSKGMSPEAVAAEFIDAFKNNTYEIHVGQTAEFYKLYLSNPTEAFNAMNAHRNQTAS